MRMTSPLRRPKQQREGQPRPGADRMDRFEVREFVIGPCPESAGIAHFHPDPNSRIVVSQVGRDCDAGHRAQGIEKMSRRMRGRNFPGEHGLDVRPLQALEKPLAIGFAKALKNASPHALRAWPEISEGHRSEIERDGRRDAARFGAARSNFDPWRGRAGKRRLIGVHELGRTWQARQGRALEPGPAEIMARLAVPVPEAMNVAES
jgi:hypothetical protein